ncbi:MAG TPA: helicase-related protein [Edaphocola sp.]|nr:helicase-related protein [Edaphocola sp.]
MNIINNQDTLFQNELRHHIEPGDEILISTTYCSMNALYEFKEVFSKAKSVRFLIDNDHLSQDLRFIYDQAESVKLLELKNGYKSAVVLNLIQPNIEFRKGKLGQQNLLIVKKKDKVNRVFLFTPHNFNLQTLGILNSQEIYFISSVEDVNVQYTQFFEQAWANSKQDALNDITQLYKKATKQLSLDFIYKYTISNIFQNKTIDEISEQRLTKTGFKESQVWAMLYNFQKDAVLGAIDKIETYGGCILADSVGLGKTFEALAVMKYYQLRNDRILVLCPKKLRDNWLIYSQNDVRNALSKDRMNFDVLNHTDLSRDKGMSGDINLETINWGNYDLLVIDESHNFRNNEPRKDTVSRYQRLMKDIIKAGVKTKVLLLSATPVNTRMNDIKNQIAFITEQNDAALDEFGITSINQTLRQAQQKFNTWMKNAESQDRDSLVDTLNGDYFKLLDLLTIARSRKHIEKYYDTADIGTFPFRRQPISLSPDFDLSKQFPTIDKVNDLINALNLKFYSPLYFVRDDRRKAYEDKYNVTTSTGIVFRQIERENSLIHLMRVNLLKRLESSIYSFRLTLESLIAKTKDLKTKIINAHENEFYFNELDINDIEMDDDRLEDLLIGGKVKALLQDLDLVKFKDHLEDDEKLLQQLLNQCIVVDVARDEKLHQLKAEIEKKLKNPINEGNRKVVVFSAFADTIKYLYNQLTPWLKEQHNLYAAQVTGGDENRTNLPNCRADLNSILINFSPISKGRDVIYPDATSEIDILFCTDCISEGQNLQDCDFLVNYDIHWNPVRIIQRFGRIDRIGSKNKEIQLVNFYPNVDLDSYIDLIGRVKGRMQILDVSATGDDNVIDETASQSKDLEYRKRQLKQLQTQVVDLEDIDGGISITDLTFNDFKIDADRLTAEEIADFELTPKGVFSIAENTIHPNQKGMLFCFKDQSAELDNNKVNRNMIYPYYLCLINQDGAISIPATHSKKSLDYFKKLASGKTELMPELLSEFNQVTKSGSNMSVYTELVTIAMNHLEGSEREMGLDSLAIPGGTLFGNELKDHNYELIAYLIIQ